MSASGETSTNDFPRSRPSAGRLVSTRARSLHSILIDTVETRVVYSSEKDPTFL